jgi:hypothetical protein
LVQACSIIAQQKVVAGSLVFAETKHAHNASAKVRRKC